MLVLRLSVLPDAIVTFDCTIALSEAIVMFSALHDSIITFEFATTF